MPRWQQALERKHGDYIADHERRFGKLGEVQTDEQRDALKAYNAEQGYDKP